MSLIIFLATHALSETISKYFIPKSTIYKKLLVLSSSVEL